MASHIDVSIEHRGPEPEPQKKHPNTCPGCHSHYKDEELDANLRVCPQCGHHFPVRARERVNQLADRGTFEEADAGLRSADPLGFFDLRAYTERLAEAEVATGLGDAMIAGGAMIERRPVELAVMDFGFMGGSMGSAVGEKFVRACERAADRRVPLVCVTASGGARMQEGILSLMQLPKTVSAVDELREPGRPHRRRAGRPACVHGPARRPADHAREAPRGLRPRGVEPALWPRGRDRVTAGAAAIPGSCADPLRAQWQLRKGLRAKPSN